MQPPPKPSPTACPAERALDLRGNLRVWLEAGDRSLIAHGWGGQRIEIPAADIGLVRTASDYQVNGTSRRDALLVLDRYDRVLLRAVGDWQTFGDLREVCRAAGVSEPGHVGPYKVLWESPRRPVQRYQGQYRTGYRYGAGYRYAYRRNFRTAPGYRRLRTSPPGRVPRLMLLFPLAAAVIAGLALVGTALGQALPQWFGEVRVPLGILGALLGAAAGYWLCGLVSDAVADALSWALTSARVRWPGPPGRFLRRPGWSAWWSRALTAVMIAGMPALTLFGLIIALLSGMHGLADSDLVAQLRAHGVQARGFLKDDHRVHVDNKGEKSVTDTGVLVFKDRHGHTRTVIDPAVRGLPLALNEPDPARTHRPVTIVYLRSDPDTAAPRREIQGSVWNGTPTANVTAGTVLLLVSPPLLIWRLVARRRWRWRVGSEYLDDIAGS